MACVWADRERQYFVSTCSTTNPGKEINRWRWWQCDETPNATPERENILLPQPQVVQVYYDGASKIDQHNHHRQDSLNLEKKLQMNAWERRTNVSIFAMIVVDSFYLFCGVHGGVTKVSARSYYEQLAEQLIENDYDCMSLCRHHEEVDELERALMAQGAPMLDPVKQLTAPTPTKRHKKNNPKHRVQGRCMVCTKLTSHMSFVATKAQILRSWVMTNICDTKSFLIEHNASSDYFGGDEYKLARVAGHILRGLHPYSDVSKYHQAVVEYAYVLCP